MGLEPAGPEPAERVATAPAAAERVGAGRALRLLLLLAELGDRGLELLAELLDRVELALQSRGLAPLGALGRVRHGLLGALGVAGEVEVGGQPPVAVGGGLLGIGVDQRLLGLGGVLPIVDRRVHVAERLSRARVGASLLKVDLAELVEDVEREQSGGLVEIVVARLDVLGPGVGSLAELLLPVAGQGAVAVAVRVAGLVVQLHEPPEGGRIVGIRRQLLLGGLDVVIEGAGRAAAAPASAEEVAEAEAAAAGAHAEEDEADREDRGQGAEGDPDDAASSRALQVEEHGGEA